MADGRAAYGGPIGLNPTLKFSSSSHDRPLDSVLASASSIPLLVSGSRAMLSFGGVGGVSSCSLDQEECVNDYLDEYFNQSEKKKRLSVDQIQFLEKNFNEENKLEPERKNRIAKELGLQPRKIAVWFQNRRARWKSRQLETDYEMLHTSYKSLKAKYDNLLGENKKLQAEVLRLKGNRVAGDKEVLQVQDTKEPLTDVMSEEGESKASAAPFKNEEQSSGKSDATNTELSRKGALRTIDSPYALEFEDWDLSQNGEDELSGEFIQSGYNFPRIEDANCHTPVRSLNYGFPFDDHSFSFWSC